jgi:DNA excision repair protein ERCC-3
MDEVHGLPAQQINKAFGELRTHFKLGLTATPYRQDDKIKEIFYKVGPKLHESMIVDLTTLGFVSKIYCV